MTSRQPPLLVPLCLLALSLGALNGCDEGAGPKPHDDMSPDEMAAMRGATPSAAGDGMTPEEMAQMQPQARAGSGDIDVAPGRLQAIGVRFERATRRALDREIRTVGRVAVDERSVARVNIKVEGWIDRLYVNTTGQAVSRGQPLFTLYSPELVATQEEYLLALKSARTLGSSTYDEVAEGARSMLEAAHRRLQLWDIAESHIRELELSGRILRTLPIHAPVSGTVIEKMAVAGMRVMPGEDLYVIADLSRVWVLADIYENELPVIEVGQTASITPSYDAAATTSGRLTFIYPTLERDTRTARVRFELDNTDGRLKPDMYVNVALDVPLGNRLVIPKDAVLESGQRHVIFVRRDDGRLAWREVRIGARAGDQVEVLEGLSEGEEVVTSANFLIDSESRVRGSMAGMAGMDMTEEEKQKSKEPKR